MNKSIDEINIEKGIENDILYQIKIAKEGSKALDNMVAGLIGWHRVEPRFTRKHRNFKSKGAWIAPEDFIGLHSDGSPICDSLHGTTFHSTPPPFTTSLDSAVSLIEKGELWSVNYNPVTDNSLSLMELNTGRAKTPALAICLAVLKTRFEKDTE